MLINNNNINNNCTYFIIFLCFKYLYYNDFVVLKKIYNSIHVKLRTIFWFKWYMNIFKT